MNNDSALKDNLKDLFDQFDEDGGGEIDASELGKVMERLDSTALRQSFTIWLVKWT